MGSLQIVILLPCGDLIAGSRIAENRVSLSSSSLKLPMKLSTKAFCIGLPGAMQCQSIRVSWHHRKTAMLVSSVPSPMGLEPVAHPLATRLRLSAVVRAAL